MAERRYWGDSKEDLPSRTPNVHIALTTHAQIWPSSGWRNAQHGSPIPKNDYV